MKLKLLANLLIIIFCSFFSYAQTPSVAKVSNIEGTAKLKEKRKNGKTRNLRKGERLYSGDRLKCGKKCKKLQITYCNTFPKTIKKEKWRTVLAINCYSRSKNIVRGGPPRTEETIFISLYQNEVINANNFSVRLLNIDVKKKFNLKLGISLGEPLLYEKDVEIKDGYIKVDCLKNKLKQAQKNNDLVLELEVIREGNEKTQKVVFNILSLKDQKNLEQDLATIEEETDEVIKVIGRSSVFSEYNLYRDAIREIEKALVLSKSQTVNKDMLGEIIKLAIIANYKLYNDKRVKELCMELTPNEKPTVCNTLDN